MSASSGELVTDAVARDDDEKVSGAWTSND
jgi:hypothetical protein